MAKVHCFILTGGYVESTTNGSVILYHPKGFNTVEDGIEALGRVFRGVTELEDAERVDHHRRYNRCPHCDKPLVVAASVDAEVVSDRIYEFLTGPIDGNSEFWEELHGNGWEAGASEVPRSALSEAVIVYQYANQIIADAAFDGRTVVEPGASGHEHVFDWARSMRFPVEGVILYRKDTGHEENADG